MKQLLIIVCAVLFTACGYGTLTSENTLIISEVKKQMGAFVIFMAAI